MSEYIYEIVDTSNEENSWPLGIFKTLWGALKAIENKNPDEFSSWDAPEEWFQIQIRERKIGMGDVGELVFFKEWQKIFSEEDDCDKWVVISEKNKTPTINHPVP